MKKVGILIALVAAMAVAVPALGSKHHSHKHHGHVKTAAKVKVADDYYSPTSKTIHLGKHNKRGKKVKFKWNAANTDPHNVTLTSGPKKLSHKDKKKLKSATGAYGVKFNPVFKKKGTYKFICTIHPDTMRFKLKVK